MVHGHIQIRDGLSLHPLCGIHHQQGTLTGSYTPGHFIRKVHMSGSIDQVKDITLSITGLVLHLDSMAFDGNTPLPLQIHIIQHLPFCDLDRMSLLQKAVSQRRLTMVNMSDDAKVSDFTDIIHALFSLFRTQRYKVFIISLYICKNKI